MIRSSTRTSTSTSTSTSSSSNLKSQSSTTNRTVPSRWLPLSSNSRKVCEDREKEVVRDVNVEESTKLYDAVRQLRKAHFGIAAMLANRVADAESSIQLDDDDSIFPIAIVKLCQASCNVMGVLLEYEAFRSKQLLDSTLLVREGFILVFRSLPILVKNRMEVKQSCHCKICLGCLLQSLARALGDASNNSSNNEQSKSIIFYDHFLQKNEPDYCQKSPKSSLSSDVQIESCWKCLRGCLDSYRLHSKEATTYDYSQVHDMIVRCLAIFIQSGFFLEVLHAEDMAQSVVASVFLTYLENKGNSDFSKVQFSDSEAGPSSDSSVELKRLIIEAIQTLLENDKHCSAIISPLVLDISSEGYEKTRRNPLKSRLLCVLQDLLLRSDFEKDADIIISCTYCLHTLLDSILELSNSNNDSTTKVMNTHSRKSDNLNVAGIARRIHLILQLRSVNVTKKDIDRLSNALLLLRSLAKAFPQEISGQWQLFLPEAISSTLPAKYRSQERPSLLEYTKIKYSDHIQVLTVNAIFSIVDSIPLQLWMGRLSKRSTKTLMSTRHIGDRIASALATLMNTISDAIWEGRNETVINSFLLLMKTVIRKIPYQKYDHLCLSAAVRLVDACYRLYWDENLQRVSTRNKEVLKAMIYSFGGVETQQGRVISMPMPVELWFDRNPNFVKALEDRSTCKEIRISNLIDRVEVLGTLYRSAPWLVQPDNFVNFLSWGVNSSRGKRLNYGMIQVVEKLLLGRQRNNQHDRVKHKLWNFVLTQLCPILYDVLQIYSTDVDIVKATIGSLGMLSGHELYDLFFRRDPKCLRIFLDWCSSNGMIMKKFSSKKQSTIRSIGLKALGDMITSLFTYYDSQNEILFTGNEMKKIICLFTETIMLGFSPDTDNSVRSKALFATGNMALALTSRDAFESMLDIATYEKLFSMSVIALTDDDEKVVSAAIRGVGHLSFGYFWLSSFHHSWKYNKDLFFRLSIDSIKLVTHKVQHALNLSDLDRKKLTWKKKSQISKHARGSCYSLLHIIRSCAFDNSLVVHTRYSVETLLRIIRSSTHQYADAKVLAAALNALLEINWSVYKNEDNFYPSILFDCIQFIQELYVNPPRKKSAINVQSVNTLLENLINEVSEDHIVSLLSIPAFSDVILEFFFAWILKRPTTTFGESKLHGLFERSLRFHKVSSRFEGRLVQHTLSKLCLERTRNELFEKQMLAGVNNASAINKNSMGNYCNLDDDENEL